MSSRSLEEFTAEEVTQMAATYNSLLSNPQTRELALRATKKLNPNLSIPEIDIKDMGAQEFQKRDQKIEELEAQIRQREAQDRIDRARSNLKGQGFSSDDVAAIEKIMVDEQIPNYGTAAKYYKQSRQLAEPSQDQREATGSRTYELPQDALASMRGGNRNGLKKWAQDQAYAALDDLKSGRVKLH